MEYPIIDTLTNAYVRNGWTGLDISTGKNLLNPIYRTVLPNNIRYYYEITGMTLEPGTYTLSCSENVDGVYVIKDNSTIFVGYDTNVLTFTLTELTENLSFNFYSYTNINPNMLCQLEKGNQATPYEPYNATTDIFSRTRLPLIRYFPHPVIDSLQRASDGTMTADDVQVLRHYLTKFGIGNIELGRFHAINPNISDDIREIDLEPIQIDEPIKEKKTGEEDLNVKTE